MRDRNKDEVESGSSFYAIFVPLYLVILAFFILINSIALIEKKKKQEAMGSLHNTFAVGSHKQLAVEGDRETLGKEISARDYFSSIATVAKDTLQLVDADIIERGGKMQLVLNSKNFFGKNERQIKKSQKQFLTSMAEKLNELNQGADIYIELFMGNESKDEDGLPLAVYRLGEAARTLTYLGINEKNIIVGVTTEDSDNLYMNFYKKE